MMGGGGMERYIVKYNGEPQTDNLLSRSKVSNHEVREQPRPSVTVSGPLVNNWAVSDKHMHRETSLHSTEHDGLSVYWVTLQGSICSVSVESKWVTTLSSATSTLYLHKYLYMYK